MFGETRYLRICSAIVSASLTFKSISSMLKTRTPFSFLTKRRYSFTRLNISFFRSTARDKSDKVSISSSNSYSLLSNRHFILLWAFPKASAKERLTSKLHLSLFPIISLSLNDLNNCATNIDTMLCSSSKYEGSIMSIVANSVFFNSGYDVSFSRLPLVNNSVTDVMHDVLPDPRSPTKVKTLLGQNVE